MNYLFLLSTLFIANFCFSQTIPDSVKVEEEDYSMYENVEDIKTITYCSQKIICLSPSKLISIGFDYVGKNNLKSDTIGNYFGSESTIKNNQGFRFSANLPIVSNTKLIFSLTLNYLDFKYNFEKTANVLHPLNNELNINGLRSIGITPLLFKPLNNKQFFILQATADFNNANKLEKLFETNALKIGAVGLYGFKPHDRLQYGFGISRTYRGGAVNYFPIILYNYTFKNKKWGVEMLLPAKANVRYTVNSRNLLFAGFELEGNSYYLSNTKQQFDLTSKNLQLNRSELRPRLTYEFSIYKFMWISIQAGYRLGFNYEVNEGDQLRAFSNKPVLMDNKVSNSYYFNISINLVSP